MNNTRSVGVDLFNNSYIVLKTVRYKFNLLLHPSNAVTRLRVTCMDSKALENCARRDSKRR